MFQHDIDVVSFEQRAPVDSLFVACADSTQVSVLDAAHDGDALETINCALYPHAPAGNPPSSL